MMLKISLMRQAVNWKQAVFEVCGFKEEAPGSEVRRPTRAHF
jgi:hypothetical protein